jgi:hypothetical protein
MQNDVRKPWVNRFDVVDPEIQIKYLLDGLQSERSVFMTVVTRVSRAAIGAIAFRWRGR